MIRCTPVSYTHLVTVAHFDICRDKGLDRVKDAELRPISGQQLLQEVAVKFDGLETLVGDCLLYTSWPL